MFKNKWIYLSFPRNIKECNLEDESIITEKERELFYGQKDHLRRYGKDYLKAFARNDCIITPIKESDIVSKLMIKSCSLKAEHGTWRDTYLKIEKTYSLKSLK